MSIRVGVIGAGIMGAERVRYRALQMSGTAQAAAGSGHWGRRPSPRCAVSGAAQKMSPQDVTLRR